MNLPWRHAASAVLNDLIIAFLLAFAVPAGKWRRARDGIVRDSSMAAMMTSSTAMTLR